MSILACHRSFRYRTCWLVMAWPPHTHTHTRVGFGLAASVAPPLVAARRQRPEFGRPIGSPEFAARQSQASRVSGDNCAASEACEPLFGPTVRRAQSTSAGRRLLLRQQRIERTISPLEPAKAELGFGPNFGPKCRRRARFGPSRAQNLLECDFCEPTHKSMNETRDSPLSLLQFEPRSLWRNLRKILTTIWSHHSNCFGAKHTHTHTHAQNMPFAAFKAAA